VVTALHEIEAIKEEQIKRDDSNQPHSSRKRLPAHDQTGDQNHAPSPPAFSPYIAAVVSDYSDELEDPQNVTSNVTQALRLWERSGLGEQQFVELLHETRKTVRRYQGKQGLGTIGNKMAYFFAALRRLVAALEVGDHSQ
jgi:hypothetical protein